MTDERPRLPSDSPAILGASGGDVRSDVPVVEIPSGTTEGSGTTGNVDPRTDGPPTRESGARTEGSHSSAIRDKGDYSGSTDREYATGVRERDDAVRENTGRIGEMFADLAREFGIIVSQQISHGRIDHYPQTNQWIGLAPGWIAKMVYNGGIRDVYIKVVTNFSPLPTHSHPQRQHVYVVSGSLALTCGDTDHRVMNEGDAMIIPADTEHSMVGNAKGDTLLLVVYEPPMMH